MGTFLYVVVWFIIGFAIGLSVRQDEDEKDDNDV